MNSSLQVRRYGPHTVGFIVISLPRRLSNWRDPQGRKNAQHDGTAMISAIHLDRACCLEEHESRVVQQISLSRIEDNPILSRLGFCRKCAAHLVAAWSSMAARAAGAGGGQP